MRPLGQFEAKWKNSKRENLIKRQNICTWSQELGNLHVTCACRMCIVVHWWQGLREVVQTAKTIFTINSRKKNTTCNHHQNLLFRPWHTRRGETSSIYFTYPSLKRPIVENNVKKIKCLSRLKYNFWKFKKTLKKTWPGQSGAAEPVSSSYFTVDLAFYIKKNKKQNTFLLHDKLKMLY